MPGFKENHAPRTALVIAVGNPLMGDDGVGVAVVRELEAQGLPPGVRALDAGTSLFDVLTTFGEGFDRWIIVDAVQGGGNPGDIHRLDRGDLDSVEEDSPNAVSLHDIDVVRAIAMAEMAGIDIPEVTVIGVEPENLELGTDLSDPVAAQIPQLVEMVRKEIVL